MNRRRSYQAQIQAVKKVLTRKGIATRDQIIRAAGVPKHAIQRMIADGIVTPSLNEHRAWLILTDQLETKSNRKGFYDQRTKKWSRKIIRFHVERTANAALENIASNWAWGITLAEANEETGRDCRRVLERLVKEDVIQVRLCNGQRVYVNRDDDKADLQINHRRTNPRLRQRIEDNGANDEPQVITFEEILEHFRATLRRLDIKLPVPENRLSALLLMFFTNRSLRTTELWLNHNPRILDAVGMIGRCVDHTTLSRAFTAVSEETLRQIFHQLVLDLQAAEVISGRILVVDATHIYAYANTRKNTKKHPVEGAAWGNHHGSFYGYKVHLLVDADSELPIGMVISPGNEHDSPSFVPLIEDFEDQYEFDEVVAVMADGAYDTAAFRDIVMDKTGGVFLPACNPRKSKILQLLKAKVKRLFDRWGDHIESVEDALRYLGQTFLEQWGGGLGSDKENKLIELIAERLHRGFRVAVERVNARLKTFTSFLRPKTRVRPSVGKTLWWCLLADVLQAATAVANGKKGSMRRRTLVV